jgi:chromosome segregation ATPase
LRDQIAKEADARQQARAELEQAQDEVARLRESAQSLTTDAEAATARSKGLLEQLQLAGEQQRALEAAKEEALARVSALERTLTESKASPPARRSTTGAESKREETDLLQKSPANTPPGMSPAAERTRGFESSPQSGRTRIDGKSNRQEDEFEERWKAWKAKGEGNTRHPLALLGLIAAIIVALVLVLSR